MGGACGFLAPVAGPASTTNTLPGVIASAVAASTDADLGGALVSFPSLFTNALSWTGTGRRAADCMTGARWVTHDLTTALPTPPVVALAYELSCIFQARTVVVAVLRAVLNSTIFSTVSSIAGALAGH